MLASRLCFSPSRFLLDSGSITSPVREIPARKPSYSSMAIFVSVPWRSLSSSSRSSLSFSASRSWVSFVSWL